LIEINSIVSIKSKLIEIALLAATRHASVLNKERVSLAL